MVSQSLQEEWVSDSNDTSHKKTYSAWKLTLAEFNLGLRCINLQMKAK